MLRYPRRGFEIPIVLFKHPVQLGLQPVLHLRHGIVNTCRTRRRIRIISENFFSFVPPPPPFPKQSHRSDARILISVFFFFFFLPSPVTSDTLKYRRIEHESR